MNQGLQFPLADSLARLDAAELVLRKATWLYDNGKPCGREANTAKYLCADAGFDAADRALQTHGGMGYSEEYHVSRYFREARLMKIAPVSQEMILNYLGEHVLGCRGATDDQSALRPGRPLGAGHRRGRRYRRRRRPGARRGGRRGARHRHRRGRRRRLWPNASTPRGGRAEASRSTSRDRGRRRRRCRPRPPASPRARCTSWSTTPGVDRARDVSRSSPTRRSG